MRVEVQVRAPWGHVNEPSVVAPGTVVAGEGWSDFSRVLDGTEADKGRRPVCRVPGASGLCWGWGWGWEECAGAGGLKSKLRCGQAGSPEASLFGG